LKARVARSRKYGKRETRKENELRKVASAWNRHTYDIQMVVIYKPALILESYMYIPFSIIHDLQIFVGLFRLLSPANEALKDRPFVLHALAQTH